MILRDDAHDALFSPATLTLGKIHWTLLKAANLMEARCWNEEKTIAGPVSTELTDFGKEVGPDEINWWVFKKETNIDDLRAETERALKAVQVLKKASAKLRSKQPESYQELLFTLRGFADQHVQEIEVFYAYVRWLEARDAMAPSILFTYRVWGSTRMSDRWIKLAPDAPTLPEERMMRTSAEIVLGVRNDRQRTYDETFNEIASEIFDSMDPTEVPYGGAIRVPASLVLARTTRAVYEECASYFTQIRDSLRNILIDIEKFEEQPDLTQSDAFWREFILKAVQTKKTEPQLWDFKATLTMWHVKQQPDRDRAKVAFAEDIASLANARGGVLVIGVSDQREIIGLGNSSRMLESWLKTARNVIERHIEYDRDITSLQQVVVPVKCEKKVCLVVVVAQARGAVGVDDGQGRYTYPVRQETGIERTSRVDLSARKMHMKSDNHDFMRDLKQFVVDN